MRYLRICAALLALGLSGCLRSQEPLNPPVLVTARDTDLAIQLFMQATILLGRYYGFDTLSYADITDRSVRRGYHVLPFMPPIARRATPRFADGSLHFKIPADVDGKPLTALKFREWAHQAVGPDTHRKLLTYYVQTGWRAAQVVCRNYLVGLDEKNAYLQFLQNEFNTGATLANASLIAAGANVTLRAIGVAVQWAGNEVIDEYQTYRFLERIGIDRDSMRALVEAAQNQFALDFLGRLNKRKFLPAPAIRPEVDLIPEFALFADAVQALSMIEYQCTRSGIRGLVHKALVAGASSKHKVMAIDPISNAVDFVDAPAIVVQQKKDPKPEHDKDAAPLPRPGSVDPTQKK
jgi:hypothetical protein